MATWRHLQVAPQSRSLIMKHGEEADDGILFPYVTIYQNHIICSNGNKLYDEAKSFQTVT
jgi:hypothetical protein